MAERPVGPRETSGATALDWAAARGEKWRANLSGMEATLAPVDATLIDALQLDAPLRIADIGCGGGLTTLEILRLAPVGSVVHGFDVSPAIIETARGRAAVDAPTIAFHVEDMAKAPPPPVLYDRLASRFGVMFFDDPALAFANLLRWLAPRGRFAFAVWGQLAENPWMTTVREVVADRVEVPTLEPGAPGPFRYGEASTFLTALERAGFGDLDVRDWRGALPIGGGLPAGEAASFALTAFSTFGELLARAGDAALDDARRALTARFAGHEESGVVRIDACVHIVTGARPAR